MNAWLAKLRRAIADSWAPAPIWYRYTTTWSSGQLQPRGVWWQPCGPCWWADIKAARTGKGASARGINQSTEAFHWLARGRVCCRTPTRSKAVAGDFSQCRWHGCGSVCDALRKHGTKRLLGKLSRFDLYQFETGQANNETSKHNVSGKGFERRLDLALTQCRGSLILDGPW